MKNETMKQKLMAALLSANSVKLNGLAFVAMMSKGKNNVDTTPHAVAVAVDTKATPHETR